MKECLSTSCAGTAAIRMNKLLIPRAMHCPHSHNCALGLPRCPKSGWIHCVCYNSALKSLYLHPSSGPATLNGKNCELVSLYGSMMLCYICWGLSTFFCFENLDWYTLSLPLIFSDIESSHIFPLILFNYQIAPLSFSSYTLMSKSPLFSCCSA